MTFYVNGIAGGNAEVGTITNSGLYTAPAVVPNSLHGPDHQLHRRSIPRLTPGLGLRPGMEPDSRARHGHSGWILRRHHNRHGEWIAVCLRRADQLERRPRSHHLRFQHQLVAQIAAPNPGTYPLTVTNPNPGSASAPPLSLEGWSRAGGAAARAELRHRRARIELAQSRPDGQRNR